MQPVSHEDQRRLWDAEHASPQSLLPMDARSPSGTVTRFMEWFRAHRMPVELLKGVEMGCGKGRNALWLAAQGMQMTAFDFSKVSITEAKRRVAEDNLTEQYRFLVVDATERWPFETASFDVGIDCFASTDIENSNGRAKARDEFSRVIKPNGPLCVSAMADSSPYHRSLVAARPAHETGALLRERGRFEKTFSREELLSFYQTQFTLEERARVPQFRIISCRDSLLLRQSGTQPLTTVPHPMIHAHQSRVRPIFVSAH
jgi:ubiquinone/menaquinone biosynthesis C-methylase UbiE